MFGQPLSDLGNPADQALAEAAFFKVSAHRRGHALPEVLPDPGVDAFVAEKDELAPGGNDEEKDAVAVFGRGHAQASEGAPGDRLDFSPEVPGHRNPDFAGRAALGVLDGGLDPAGIDRPDHFTLMHEGHGFPLPAA